MTRKYYHTKTGLLFCQVAGTNVSEKINPCDTVTNFFIFFRRKLNEHIIFKNPFFLLKK